MPLLCRLVFVREFLIGVSVGLFAFAERLNVSQEGKEGQSLSKLRLPRERKVVAPDHGEPGRRLSRLLSLLEGPRSRLIVLTRADESWSDSVWSTLDV